MNIDFIKVKKWLYLNYILLVLLLLQVDYLRCQDRGVTIINNSNSKPNEIWGLIIGISEYKKLPVHNQLQFADADALAFYNLLLHHVDVKKSNISLLLNEDANQGAIYSKLSYILNNAQPNDLVFFYFAGHGDVSSKIDDGFFLLSNVVSDQYGDYYSSDVLVISDLRKYLAEYARKNIKVVLITDACRSGKVLDEEGAKNTFSVLMTEWNKVIKLASCEPGEFSYEDKKWGNGHGVFTYYLIKGLKGMSDKDSDRIIQLGELYDDIKLNVNEQTKDSITKRAKQNPVKSGPSFFNVLNIDILTKTPCDIDTPVPGLSSFGIKPRGISGFEKFNYNALFYRALALGRFSNAGNPDKEVSILNTKKFTFEKFAISNSYYNEKSNFFALWDNSGEALIYNLDKNDFKTLNNSRQSGNSNYLQHIFLSSDGKLFGKCFYNKTISIIDCEKDTTILSVKIDKDPLYVTFSGNDNLVIAYRDKLDLISFKKAPKIINSINITKVAKFKDLHNNNFIIQDINNCIYIINLNTLEIIHKTSPSKLNIKDFEFDASRNRLVILSDGKLFTQKLGTDNKNLNLLNEDVGNFNKLLLIGPDSHLLLSSPDSIRFYDLISNLSYKSLKIPKGSIVYALNEILYFIQNSTYQVTECKIELPPPYAIDLLDYFPASQKDSLRLLLGNLLQNKANNVIEPFLTSKFILPTSVKIKEALQETNLALELLVNDSLLNKQIIVKRNILAVLLIIVSNKMELFDNAISLMNYNLKLYPNASYPYFLMGLIQKKKNELTLAKQNFGYSKAMVPKWAEPKIKLGKALFYEGKFEESNREYDKLISSNPTSILGYYHKANNFELRGYFRESEDLLQKALTIDSTNFALYNTLGEIYFKRGRFLQSENFFKKSIEKSLFNYQAAYLNLSRLYFHIFANYTREDTLIALCFKNLKIALDLDSLNIDVRLFTTEVFVILSELKITYSQPYLHIGDPREFASKTIMMDTYNSKSYYFAALTEFFNKKFETGGRYVMQQAIRINPNYPYSYFYFGCYLDKIGKTDSSIYYFKKAIGKNPLYLPPYLSLIKLYNLAGRTKELSDLCLHADSIFPENILYQFQKLLFLGNTMIPSASIKSLIKLENMDSKFVFTRLLKPFPVVGQKNNADLQLNYDKLDISNDGTFIIKNAWFLKQPSGIVKGTLVPWCDF